MAQKASALKTVRSVPNWIEGRRRKNDSGRTGKVFDSATGEQCAEVVMSSAANVAAAVAAAEKAFPAWSRTPVLRGLTNVLGAVWAATGEWIALPAAVAAGVLPDADHLWDFYVKYVKRDQSKLFLLFHGWEFLLAAVIVYIAGYREPWFLGAMTGYATQIGGDQVFNNVRWHTYFLSARIWLRFSEEKVIGERQIHAYSALVNRRPCAGRAPISAK